MPTSNTVIAHAATALLVLTLTAAHALSQDSVTLTNGDVLIGSIVEQTDEHIVIDHPVLGSITIANDEIVTIVRDDGDDDDAGEDAAVVDDESAAAAADAEPDDLAAEEEDPWESFFKLGLAASFGNTDTQNVNVGVDSLREKDDMRTKLDASYYYGATDGDRSDNRFTAGVNNDWLVPDSRWLYFGRVRFDYDEFQSWEYRIGAWGGVGYDFYDREDFTLTGRAGLGLVKEFNSDRNEIYPEGLLGLDMSWDITERQKLTASTTIYPDLDETGEYRSVSSVDWSALVDEQANMSVFFGLEHEYQSEVDEGIDEHDLRLIAGLQFEF